MLILNYLSVDCQSYSKHYQRTIIVSSKMISSKNNNHVLRYKVAKIVSLIRKIRSRLQEEGLDHKQLPFLINQSLKLDNNLSLNESYNSSTFEQLAVNSLTENSSKFTASALLALSQTYKNLVSSLDQESTFLDLKEICSTKQTKITSVKVEQVFLPSDIKRERSSVVKIEEGFDIQNGTALDQRELEIQKIKKDLYWKRKQMKMLRAQIQARKNQFQTLDTGLIKKDKKSKRK